MLIVSLKPGHDGSVAVLDGNTLSLVLEAEKDSHARFEVLTPSVLVQVAQRLDRLPDVVAMSGWAKRGPMRNRSIGSGYGDPLAMHWQETTFFGKPIRLFSSSHVRSHIMAAIGLGPERAVDRQTALVWEGGLGGFHVLDEHLRVVTSVPVLYQPGQRFALLFALADPSFPDSGCRPRREDSGKLMALAAFGDHTAADEGVKTTVKRILTAAVVDEHAKLGLRDSPLYNCGVESDAAKTAAAFLSRVIFDVFAHAARTKLPAGGPLLISGGCGLNCEWNRYWRDSGLFSDVFVPPCANDSGSAVGTGIDALHDLTGNPYVKWSVYAGTDFVRDTDPGPSWDLRAAEPRRLARRIAEGAIVAWVQGRHELGPRALGNRSLLAEPFDAATRDRLNVIKQRESYRPIAPVCRVEDLASAFDQTFEDPYMLYFRQVVDERLRAVTHVDGSARVQTVSARDNPALHRLLSAFAGATGIGVLCNTSLNFKGHGFVNRTTDLIDYCNQRGIDDFVIGDDWYQRRVSGPPRQAGDTPTRDEASGG